MKVAVSCFNPSHAYIDEFPDLFIKQWFGYNQNNLNGEYAGWYNSHNAKPELPKCPCKCYDNIRYILVRNVTDDMHFIQVKVPNISTSHWSMAGKTISSLQNSAIQAIKNNGFEYNKMQNDDWAQFKSEDDKTIIWINYGGKDYKRVFTEITILTNNDNQQVILDLKKIYDDYQANRIPIKKVIPTYWTDQLGNVATVGTWIMCVASGHDRMNVAVVSRFTEKTMFAKINGHEVSISWDKCFMVLPPEDALQFTMEQ
jgi:hypothetical protein